MLDQEIKIAIEKAQQGPGQLLAIREELASNPKTIVILDDDPTGTQTVSGIPVITEWTNEVLEHELKNSSVFFILTNSRSLQATEAVALGKLIGKRLQDLAAKLDKKLLVISRSDSTLRGHYPLEVDALVSGMGLSNAKHMLVPAFFEGGRYTFNDVHFVKEGNSFIPAGKTPFAKDNTFGYEASDLKDWIAEKYDGKLPKHTIASIPLELLENQKTESVVAILESNATHLVANALSKQHLQTIALASLRTSNHIIFRTGASFINAIAGIEPRTLLSKDELLGKSTKNGALIVVGSYVPKTTEQLNYLLEKSEARFLELEVKNVENAIAFQNEVLRVSKEVNDAVKSGYDVVLYTSRKVVSGKTKIESLEIINRISNGVTQVVKNLEQRPRYILAKGGITSSDIATKALAIKKAMIMGQILKGIPVWKSGQETKFPDLSYIVFPGNVGETDALHKIVKLLK
ncbi:hypothetical protein JQC67_07010 [Aurantibacter crassamenti]|uniref:four-carbon acid sugar kinase family protein n=1 Tax=Aurantibacter crassamenti TaxID=1837375 RepID=UPI00193A367F|nr:four-carbon acid sugar kinase family protein [Aurantibacter crassamenti]MBM1105880.1 hypothetical protein [Aurantibacter crassamenti]